MQTRKTVILALVTSLATGLAVNAAQAQDARTKAAPCGACHGLTGNSPTPLWPNLAGQHPAYTTAQLKAFKSGARRDPNMDAMSATLSDQDIEDLAGFFAAQEANVGSIAPESVAAGQAIYRGGNADKGVPACMACHGPNGIGNAPAGYPALRGQHAEYTKKQLSEYRSGTRSTDPNSMMRTIAERLTDAEIDAVASYISALH
ncbi:MAG: cytochrome c4 [Gammaproteobacteria bacterium]|nr:cytochrome c4 [Gammaproteobacteria bacterium]